MSPVNICLRYGCRELKQDFSKIEAKEKLQTYRTSTQHEIRSYTKKENKKQRKLNFQQNNHLINKENCIKIIKVHTEQKLNINMF